MLPLKVHEAAAAALQAVFWYEPVSVPFAHVLDSDAHVEPKETDAAWYAVIEEPLLTVLLFQVHDDGAAPTTHVAEAYEPLRTPLVHERCSLRHAEPAATAGA